MLIVHPMFCLHSGLFRIEIDFPKHVSTLDHSPDTERPEPAAS
jgi:hypothetical protein